MTQDILQKMVYGITDIKVSVTSFDITHGNI